MRPPCRHVIGAVEGERPRTRARPARAHPWCSNRDDLSGPSVSHTDPPDVLYDTQQAVQYKAHEMFGATPPITVKSIMDFPQA